jgi:hypothetical protein
MSKPEELVQLVEELKAEGNLSFVEITRTSKAIFYLDDDDAKGFELSGEECRVLLASPSTVYRMVDTLPESSEISIELFDIVISDDVRDALERKFATVDEG